MKKLLKHRAFLVVAITLFNYLLFHVFFLHRLPNEETWFYGLHLLFWPQLLLVMCGIPLAFLFFHGLFGFGLFQCRKLSRIPLIVVCFSYFWIGLVIFKTLQPPAPAFILVGDSIEMVNPTNSQEFDEGFRQALNMAIPDCGPVSTQWNFHGVAYGLNTLKKATYPYNSYPDYMLTFFDIEE